MGGLNVYIIDAEGKTVAFQGNSSEAEANREILRAAIRTIGMPDGTEDKL